MVRLNIRLTTIAFLVWGVMPHAAAAGTPNTFIPSHPPFVKSPKHCRVIDTTPETYPMLAGRSEEEHAKVEVIRMKTKVLTGTFACEVFQQAIVRGKGNISQLMNTPFVVTETVDNKGNATAIYMREEKQATGLPLPRIEIGSSLLWFLMGGSPEEAQLDADGGINMFRATIAHEIGHVVYDHLSKLDDKNREVASDSVGYGVIAGGSVGAVTGMVVHKVTGNKTLAWASGLAAGAVSGRAKQVNLNCSGRTENSYKVEMSADLYAAKLLRDQYRYGKDKTVDILRSLLLRLNEKEHLEQAVSMCDDETKENPHPTSTERIKYVQKRLK